MLQAAYEPIHGYLAVTVCILGILFNLVNILVLTHKDMRSNPINLLLTGIAVADMLVMMEYIPFAVHMYLLEERSLEQEVGGFQYVWKYRLKRRKRWKFLALSSFQYSLISKCQNIKHSQGILINRSKVGPVSQQQFG